MEGFTVKCAYDTEGTTGRLLNGGFSVGDYYGFFRDYSDDACLLCLDYERAPDEIMGLVERILDDAEEVCGRYACGNMVCLETMMPILIPKNGRYSLFFMLYLGTMGDEKCPAQSLRTVSDCMTKDMKVETVNINKEDDYYDFVLSVDL